MFYNLIGYAGIVFMYFFVFMLIKYRQTIKVKTKKIILGFIGGSVSMLISFITLILWQDITGISFITVLIGTFVLIWAMDKSKVSFDNGP